jgi:glucokinase
VNSAATSAARVLGIDVGGTSMKAGVWTRHADGSLGERECTVRRATPPDESAADALAEFAEALIAEHGPVDAVGLAIPGIVDDEAGIAEFSVAPTWTDLPLRTLISARLGLPVALGHDTRIGGLAEGRAGAALGCRDYLFVTLGTGVGGMVCLDGSPRLGPHHRAAELGHVVVDPFGVACGCGQHGCLETIASATGIARMYASDGSGGGDNVSAREVAERAAAGEPRAVEVWQTAVSALATTLISAITLLDLSLVVLGGGVAQAGDQLLVPLRRELAARLTFQRAPELVRAQLGDEAAVLGAALIALDLLDEIEPSR